MWVKLSETEINELYLKRKKYGRNFLLSFFTGVFLFFLIIIVEKCGIPSKVNPVRIPKDWYYIFEHLWIYLIISLILSILTYIFFYWSNLGDIKKYDERKLCIQCDKIYEKENENCEICGNKLEIAKNWTWINDKKVKR